MRTAYTVFRPNSKPERGEIDWPISPTIEQLHALIDPILGADFEHVSVEHNSHRAVMFVDERGRIKRLPRNEMATAVYRAASLRRTPKTRAECLPWIAGPAVVFDRIVWV